MNETTESAERFDQKMHRASPSYPLPVHIPDGPLNRILLVSPVAPPPAKSCMGIEVQSYRNGNLWNLEFRLRSSKFESVFKSFYEDLMEKAQGVGEREAAARFIEIYNGWREAFSLEGSSRFVAEVIRGLVGELVVARDVLVKELGPSCTLKSWMITQSGRQDFVTGDTWYEVKTVTDGSSTVKITSVEQLDDPSDGNLLVVRLKKTSQTDAERVTVSSLVQELYGVFSNCGLGDVFLGMLKEFGLSDPSQYDDSCFRIMGIDKFRVTGDFPCIRRRMLPGAVETVEYRLNLKSLSDFRWCDGESRGVQAEPDSRHKGRGQGELSV